MWGWLLKPAPLVLLRKSTPGGSVLARPPSVVCFP
jgi:hypothetical protein